MRRRILFVLFFACISEIAFGQDAVFSQFYNASLYLNPALAGDEENVVLNASYRSQWNRIHFPYTTTQASLIVPHYRNQHRTPAGHNGGFGVSLYNDFAGTSSNFSTIGGSLAYAYNLLLDKKGNNRISFAIQAGFIQKKINTDDLEWGSMYEQYSGFTGEAPNTEDIGSRTYLDINSGAFYRYSAPVKSKKRIKTVYSGVSVAHLNHPNESPIRNQTSLLPLLYRYHGGVVFGISRHSSISANVLTLFQKEENQTNFGSYYTYAVPVLSGGKYTDFLFRVGGWYRVGDACIANMEFVLDRFKVGFSYDWNVSTLRYNNLGVGAYEVTLGINFTRFAPPKVRY
jgi:type IX secretion system PorP/SprF family membrane protein